MRIAASCGVCTQFEQSRVEEKILTVTKTEGRVITDTDWWEDNLKLKYVQITKNSQTTRYTAEDESEKPILEEAQKQFKAYHQKIKETRTDQRLENLK